MNIATAFIAIATTLTPETETKINKARRMLGMKPVSAPKPKEAKRTEITKRSTPARKPPAKTTTRKKEVQPSA